MLTGLRARVRRVRSSADAGISLLELMMSMVLTSILGAITLMLFIAVDKSTSTTTDRAVNAAKARNVLQAWSSYLQVSDGPTAGAALNRFEWFTPSSVLFYADLYNRSGSAGSLGTTSAPKLVWLRLDSAKQLVEEQFTPIPTSFPASWKTCRILGGGVSATKLFTAYGSQGNDLSSFSMGTAASVGAGCQKLPSALPSQAQHPDQIVSANLQKIFSVGIDFTVSDTKNSHPLQFNEVTAVPYLAGAS